MPIDFVHLSRQCQGDGALERELLGLFAEQARAIAAALTVAKAAPEANAAIAHKLRGSALAIGAMRVARAAAAVEDCARAKGWDQRLTTELQASLAEAVDAIERLRR